MRFEQTVLLHVTPTSTGSIQRERGSEEGQFNIFLRKFHVYLNFENLFKGQKGFHRSARHNFLHFYTLEVI